MVTAEDLSDVGSESAVLSALGDPDGNVYDTAVIQQKLTEARVIIATNLTESSTQPTDGQIEQAVVAVAAYKTATVTPRATRKEAANVSKEYDVANYLSGLEDAKEDAVDGITGGPATFEVY